MFCRPLPPRPLRSLPNLCMHSSTIVIALKSTILPSVAEDFPFYTPIIIKTTATMKIQSSLLILAAMVGSATAANKRKRVFKIYSPEDIASAEGRVLQKDQNDKPTNQKPGKNPEPVVAMSMSMTMSPSGSPSAGPVTEMSMIITSSPTAMSMMTMCAFCHGSVMPNPDVDLAQGQTCGSIKEITAKMDATDKNCELAKMAEQFCCPVVETTTTEATMPEATTTFAIDTTTTAATEAVVTTTEAAITTTEAAVSPPTPTPPPPT